MTAGNGALDRAQLGLQWLGLDRSGRWSRRSPGHGIDQRVRCKPDMRQTSWPRERIDDDIATKTIGFVFVEGFADWEFISLWPDFG